ncbi:MAG: glutathione S-transferase family protein [Myxococcales bacterium]|nr:glutathione S-transferase family protein [Myxococcales bacterium]
MTDQTRIGYTLYGVRLSLFTRKMEAALELQGVPHLYRAKTVFLRSKLEARAGTHLIPLLETPEGWLLYDSTPMIELLGARYPATRLIPSDASGVIVRLVEEWLDEWFSRAVLHFRWNNPESASVAAAAIAAEMTPFAPRFATRRLARTLQHWGGRACRAFGLESAVQRAGVEEEALRLYQALEKQLETTPFALGARPTAVDAALLGGLRAHMLPDPAPRRLLEEFPRVLAWAGPSTTNDPSVGAPSGDESTALRGASPLDLEGPLARAIFELAGETFLGFVSENRRAANRGEGVFYQSVYGESTSFRVRPEMERARRMLAERIVAAGHRPALARVAERTDDARWLELWGQA